MIIFFQANALLVCGYLDNILLIFCLGVMYTFQIIFYTRKLKVHFQKGRSLKFRQRQLKIKIALHTVISNREIKVCKYATKKT